MDIASSPKPSLLRAPVAESRRKRWQVEKERRFRIVIDMREFMSRLPAVLHRMGFQLIPMTLEVRPCNSSRVFRRQFRLEIMF